MNWLNRLFFALAGLAFIQIAYYYPKMPDVVASHFDGLGAANDWSSRNGFFGLYAALLLLLVVVFIYVPSWSEKRARFGMKIPNREYWLAPERIEQTRQFFRCQVMLIGVLHLSLMIIVMQLAIQANFNQIPQLHPGIGWALGLYFVILIAWLVHFYRHFRKP